MKVVFDLPDVYVEEVISSLLDGIKHHSEFAANPLMPEKKRARARVLNEVSVLLLRAVRRAKKKAALEK